MLTPASIRFLAAFYTAYADHPITDEAISAALVEADPMILRDQAAFMEPAARTPWMVEQLVAAYNVALPAGKTRLPAIGACVRSS